MSIVFTISGAFGSGRSSVVNLACKLLDGLDLAIPYTTRTPQIVDNGDGEFFFTSREVFEHMIARGEFLEYVSILGNYYGTPRHYLQQARENGKDLIVQVDDRGVAQIKQKIPDAVSILVLPGQYARDTHAFVLATNPRLPFLLREVLLPSFEEVLLPSQMPNPDKYDQVIVNDRLEDSANRVIEVILSERLRHS
jgi:guanylate kinase